MIGLVLVSAGAAVADSVVLYFGTLPGPSFVHRWVLMAVGIVSGMAWMYVVKKRNMKGKGSR